MKIIGIELIKCRDHVGVTLCLDCKPRVLMTLIKHDDLAIWLDSEGYLSGSDDTHSIEAGQYRNDTREWNISYADFEPTPEIIYDYLKAKKITSLQYDKI